MNYRALPAIYILVFCLVGCAPKPSESNPDPNTGPDTSLTFLSFNMYIGFEAGNLITSGKDYTDPVNVLEAGKSLYEEFLQSHPQERVAALAESIAVLSPDVVGLQEVLHIQNEYEGGTVDFLDALLTGITAGGGRSYQVARQHLNPIHLKVAVVNDTIKDSIDIYFYEGNALLFDPDLTKTREDSLKYDTPFTFYYLDTSAQITRGFIQVTLQNPAGGTVTIFNTHLEVVELYSSVQATELLSYIDSQVGAQEAVVIMGDINNPPAGRVTAKFLAAGFSDAQAAFSAAGGATCCADLFTGTYTSTQRIDYFFTRHITGADTVFTALDGGFKAADNNYYRISDHNGVVATLTYH